MKKLLCLAIILLAAATAHAQYVDTLVEYFDYQCKKIDPKSGRFHYFRIAKKTETGSWHVKEYYAKINVLKMEGVYSDDSMTVQEGQFYYYHANGQLAQSGQYYHGKKVSLWRGYGYNGQIIDSSYYTLAGIPYNKMYHWHNDGTMAAYGEYDMKGSGAGYEVAYYPDSSISYYAKFVPGYLKDSTCIYFHINGKPSLIEYYDSGKLLKYECYDTNGKLRPLYCDTAQYLPLPFYDPYMFINRNLSIPLEAQENYGKGEYIVYLGFAVDYDGSIVEREIIRGSYQCFNKEVLRATQAMPKWKPGRQNNRTVKTYFTLPITFRLE